MSESEDFDSLKVTELQNELKKRGLDTKGRKADLITRLRQATNNGIEVDERNNVDPDVSDEESGAVIVKDDTSSPSSAIEDEDEAEQQPSTESIPTDDPSTTSIELTTSKKRRLTDEEKEEGEDNEVDKTQDEDIETTNNNNNETDELTKQRRKKKSRWGSEEEESTEKPINTKRTSSSDDTVDDSSTTTSSSRHHRSSKQHDDERHYSNRPSQKSTEKELPLPEEETVEFNNDDVVLDFYTSDLNLTINIDCLSASNKCNDALCFLWAGTRATYGFKEGKICYEIRITEIIECPQMPDGEKEKFGIRVGWSNLYSGLNALQLGEVNDSFAYTCSGKKMSKVNDELTEDVYGESFGLSDILGCYIDFGRNDEEEEEEKKMIRISFTKNGQDYGEAFELDRKTVFNNADESRLMFYPQILVKNIKFQCNFGQLESPWSEIKTGYSFAQMIPLNERTRCSEPIAEKNDCQIILLSGVTASGKTTWAKKYIEQNPTKKFNLLNVESVFSKMAIDGILPIIKDRNDATMLRVNICLQKLIEIASQRRRNFIIDHVNTSRDTQAKRQRLFTGYHRIGVVIVPNDDELKTRIEKVEKTENISIPSQWIRDAKAKFHFLQKSSSLEEIIYPELSYEDAKSLYEKANRDCDQHRSSSSRDDHRSSRNDRNRNNDRDYGNRDRDRDRDRERDRDRFNRHDRSRSRDRTSRDRDRDRDRRTSRDDSRVSSSRRNDNYNDSRNNSNYRGGRGLGRVSYSDYRQDSRSNNYNQRGSFNEGGGSGNYHGRGGSGGNYNNQSNDGWRTGFNQQPRNDFGGGRARGDFRGGNQYNNRGSYHDNQRGGGGAFRSDFNNQQRGRQFNEYDNNNQQHKTASTGFIQNNNNFNSQQDRQGFASRPPMQQQQNPFQNQQRPQPLLQNPPQQQFPSHHQQQLSTLPSQQQQSSNNPTLSLQTQNPLGINPLSSQPGTTSLDSWFAIYAAALNPQVNQQQQQQQQQDTNSLTQQWAQWLKTAQMAQTAQQAQPHLTVSQSESQQVPDASALYYQAYYAQLAAAQQQAAAAAAGSANGAVAPPGSNDK